MLTNILYLCVGILLCFVLWRVVLGFFLTGLGVSHKIVRYTLLHYMLICIYVVFAYIMGLYCINGAIYIDMLYTQDSMFVALCCLMGFVLLHILSVLDLYTQKVPNILLAILFICANILYYVTHEMYDLYAFGVLGIVYGVYFMLHLVGSRQYLGEGDVWIIASLAVILESFFAYQISFIFEMLCVASLMGILYFYFNVWRLKRVRSSGYNVKCDNVDSIECDEISKLNDIRDFSPSARTIRKNFAHTCKNDKILDSKNHIENTKQNLDSIKFAPLHPAPTHLDKNLDSTQKPSQSPAYIQAVESLESRKMHPKPCIHPDLVENLESKNCHTEQSEVSSIESRRGLDSIKDFKKDISPFSKAQYDKILESNNPATIQAIENLDSKNFTQKNHAHNQTKNNIESKPNNLTIKQIPFIPFLSLSFLCVSAYHVA
ncbi:prepilin peptidase [Helicobacter bilis]|uniref:Prepilin peptidase n=1 Tax=Helicobacter bilis TaxID=37372 RepID=A0A4U8U8S9_9HELI|nr:prepilin peptidase [Helicobacter bilis]TLE10672.1 prepilin peptidase [Helicobacter bilis]